MKNNPLPGIPNVESPLFNNIFNPATTDKKLLKIAQELNEKGYVVLPGAEFGFEGVCDEIRSALKDEFDLDAWRRQREAGNRAGVRIQDCFDRFEPVRRLAANPKILDLLKSLYGREAFPFQTLNFPVGTEQHFHTDSIHFSSYPEKWMCGVWVALEDIGPEQGPLVYYPGSHKLPVYENAHYGVSHAQGDLPMGQARYEEAWREMVESLDLKPVEFHAKKGDALIWAANLLHGGTPHNNPDKTRWSQVTHYYFDDTIYYTPMASDMPIGSMHFREPVDQLTSTNRKNYYVNKQIDEPILDRAKILMQEKNSRVPRDFDPAKYVSLHKDIAESGANPEKHYLQFGRKEGRRYK